MLQQFYEEERKKKSNLTTSSLLFGGSSTSPVVDDAILNTANKAVSTASNWFGSVLEAAVNTFTLEEPTTSNNNKRTVNNIEVSPIPVKPNNIIANKTNKKKEKLLVDEIERGELNKIVVKPSNNSKSTNISSTDTNSTKINKISLNMVEGVVNLIKEKQNGIIAVSLIMLSFIVLLMVFLFKFN